MPYKDSDKNSRAVQTIPGNTGMDSSLALFRDGYLFISRQCNRHNSDVVQTRLLLENTICMRGREAAEVFYDQDRFTRAGATPKRVQKTLFGQGGVQGLDGTAHRHRKAMFMALMTPAEIERLANLTIAQWQTYIDKWATMDNVVLFDEITRLLCQSICTWTGVPLDKTEVDQRSREMKAMIDGAGGVAFRYIQGRLARRQAERWAAGLIRRVRARELELSEECALFRIAWHRNREGGLMKEHEAAVELINVLRPTVAVARYIIFAALALHYYPACRERLADGDTDYLEMFVQEVRRFYPFFPFVAARVRNTFVWHDYRFPQGIRVLLDLYGTNHDAAYWKDPDIFRPERFAKWSDDAYGFIPQGGGGHYLNHRCAGEWATVALMKSMTEFLVRSIDYNVPVQDLSIDLSRIPAIPASRFIINNVKAD